MRRRPPEGGGRGLLRAVGREGRARRRVSVAELGVFLSDRINGAAACGGVVVSEPLCLHKAPLCPSGLSSQRQGSGRPLKGLRVQGVLKTSRV